MSFLESTLCVVTRKFFVRFPWPCRITLQETLNSPSGDLQESLEDLSAWMGGNARRLFATRGNPMSRIRMKFAFAILSGVVVAALASTAAAQQKGPNVQDSPKVVKETDATKALQNVELASRLIQYGRQYKHAESLLIAAQILHKNPTAKLNAGFSVKGEKNEKAVVPAAPDNRPQALVAEAKKLSSFPHVASLAAATLAILDEAPRGAAGGPKSAVFTIKPGQMITWNPITFVGLQKGIVHINNGVFGAMDLEIFDEFGNRVARDNIPGTYFRAEWTPAFNGPFTIRLTNRDTISFNCVLTTN